MRGTAEAAWTARKFAASRSRSTVARAGRSPSRTAARFMPVRRSSRAAPVEVLEARVLLDEGKLHHAGGAVALLADDDLGHPAVLLGGLVLLLAVDEHHDVRVLLQPAGFPKVRQLWPLLGARLRRARELRQGEDGDRQLLGQPLQRAAHRRDLLLAVLRAARRGDE